MCFEECQGYVFVKGPMSFFNRLNALVPLRSVSFRNHGRVFTARINGFTLADVLDFVLADA